MLCDRCPATKHYGFMDQPALYFYAPKDMILCNEHMRKEDWQWKYKIDSACLRKF